MGFDDRGKVRLSMKFVDQETGLEIPREEGDAPAEDNGGDDKPKRPRRPRKRRED